jgi:hypothetical protein
MLLEIRLILTCQEPEISASFLHSPLFYWNSSAVAIESDDSILTTIDSLSQQSSQANITLRPSSVLAGMLLSDSRPVAADALVVSLFYKAGSKAGDLWDELAEGLMESSKNRWKIFSADGRGTQCTFFKFESRPVSAQDETIFLGSYSLVLLYVFFSLRNVRTLKSRVWVFIMIAVQVSMSQFIHNATIPEEHHTEVS